MNLYDSAGQLIVWPYEEVPVRHVSTGRIGVWNGDIGLTSDGLVSLRVNGDTREHSWSPEDIVMEY